jgi:hypothetical protein
MQEPCGAAEIAMPRKELPNAKRVKGARVALESRQKSGLAFNSFGGTPMPPYDPTPFANNNPVLMLIPGNPAYAYGSKNTLRPIGRLAVTSVAIASNVATVGVKQIEGNIPAVGDLITVTDTTTDSGAANVNNIALTAVSINATTGIGTITYPATGTNQATTADVGMAFAQVPEVGETLVVGKSRAMAIQNTKGQGYGISWAYTCPSAPSTIAIQLEGAINENDAEYAIIGTSQTTTSGYNEITATVPELVNFVRLHVTATTGGSSPTLVGKILQA